MFADAEPMLDRMFAKKPDGSSARQPYQNAPSHAGHAEFGPLGCVTMPDGAGNAAPTALFAAVLAARGDLAPGGKVPEKFIAQAVKEIVMHEVGHTLGLRHNFKASSISRCSR